MKRKEFKVEQFNPSDQEYTITEIYFTNGKYVTKGELILSLESSKADLDVEIEEDGFFYTNHKVGDSVEVGEVLYIISEEVNIKEVSSNINKKEDSFLLISKKAEKLLGKHSIDPKDIKKKSISERDVLEYLSKKDFSLKEIEIKSDPDKTIIILGGKGGGKMIVDALINHSIFKEILILDDNIDQGSKIGSGKVIGGFNQAEELILKGYNNFVVGFGILTNRKLRYNIYTKLKDQGASFPNIIHPMSLIEPSVVMGEGNVFLGGCNIGSYCEIGNLNYFNNGCLISHDCKIKDNSHFAPASVLGSSIKVENDCLIGMNTTLYFGISIGENAVINNGLNINKSINSNSIINENR